MVVLPVGVDLSLEGIQAVPVQALVLALIHVGKGGARSEIQVLTYYELLVDAKVSHDLRRLHLLDNEAALNKQSILFLVLYCIHCKYLVI